MQTSTERMRMNPNSFPSPLSSPVIPLPHNDVDTDQIIPARYLKVTDKNGLAEGLFYEWRYHPDGTPKAEFPLNRAEYQGAQIMVAGDNFGCGSSREHAPWALTGWGIRAVVSTRFADIFRNNAVKNGLLLVLVGEDAHRQLFDLIAQDPSARVTIDLESQSLVFPDGSRAQFPIDPFDKRCLLQGVDQLGYLLNYADQIDAFEKAHGIA
jgi:3-isopropylmalate/(R)-2-methylmalate dehydratase small subunit